MNQHDALFVDCFGSNHGHMACSLCCDSIVENGTIGVSRLNQSGVGQTEAAFFRKGIDELHLLIGNSPVHHSRDSGSPGNAMTIRAIGMKPGTGPLVERDLFVIGILQWLLFCSALEILVDQSEGQQFI